MDKFAELHARRAAAQALVPVAPTAPTAVSSEIAALIGLPAEQATNALPELTAALRACSPRARIVLRALANNDFVVSRAKVELEAIYEWATPGLVGRLLGGQKARAARKLLEAQVAESVGITAASTMARINNVVEGAIVERDRENALRGLGMLAKITKLIDSGAGGNNVQNTIVVKVEERYSDLKQVEGVRVIEG